MNNLQYEQYKRLDEYSRHQLAEEIKAEKLIQHYRLYHPGIFERMMFRFGTWMISIGNGLRRRYEIPSTKYSQTALSNFAK